MVFLAVINSWDLFTVLIAIFGERGRHARFVVGCSSLPFDLAVEIEGIFEIE